MASSMRRRKRPSPKQARAAAVRELQLQQRDAKLDAERELVEINALLRKERAALPAFERRFRSEDPRSAFYFRMLRRVGLPEVHARFAPWFLKSRKLRLGRWSAALFSRLEAAFYAQPERLTTLEQRMRAHHQALAAVKASALTPREQSRTLLQRAFRACSFPPPDNNEAAVDAQLEPIREVVPAAGAAPPGLAPAVTGGDALESLGKHAFFSYAGKWRRGEMAGALGVYAFADGGKYRGEWQTGAPHGAGTAEFPNGVTYTGAFASGRFHGFGVMELAGSFRYAGGFLNGERSGVGTLELLATGARYEGEFFQDQRHGKGTETSALGFSYTGEWRGNRLCGKGWLVFPDGRTREFRADWPRLTLGEAVRMVKRERRGARERQEMEERRLLRVRDDLRALDLHEAWEAAEDARREKEDEARVDELKQARRSRREAQAAAKRAFIERAQREEEDAARASENSQEEEEEGEEEEEEEEEEEKEEEEDDK